MANTAQPDRQLSLNSINILTDQLYRSTLNDLELEEVDELDGAQETLSPGFSGKCWAQLVSNVQSIAGSGPNGGGLLFDSEDNDIGIAFRSDRDFSKTLVSSSAPAPHYFDSRSFYSLITAPRSPPDLIPPSSASTVAGAAATTSLSSGSSSCGSTGVRPAPLRPLSALACLARPVPIHPARQLQTQQQQQCSSYSGGGGGKILHPRGHYRPLTSPYTRSRSAFTPPNRSQPPSTSPQLATSDYYSISPLLITTPEIDSSPCSGTELRPSSCVSGAAACCNSAIAAAEAGLPGSSQFAGEYSKMRRRVSVPWHTTNGSTHPNPATIGLTGLPGPVLPPLHLASVGVCQALLPYCPHCPAHLSHGVEADGPHRCCCGGDNSRCRSQPSLETGVGVGLSALTAFMVDQPNQVGQTNQHALSCNPGQRHQRQHPQQTYQKHHQQMSHQFLSCNRPYLVSLSRLSMDVRPYQLPVANENSDQELTEVPASNHDHELPSSQQRHNQHEELRSESSLPSAEEESPPSHPLLTYSLPAPFIELDLDLIEND